MDRKNEDEGLDDAHIRPVSSLLSHFEHLSTSTKPSNADRSSPEPTPRLPRPQNLSEPVQTYGRGSLDIQRSRSPSERLEIPQKASSPSFQVEGSQQSQSRNATPPGVVRQRPLSMQFGTSPRSPRRQNTPILTVHSPRSPPRGVDLQRMENIASLSRPVSNISPKHGSELRARPSLRDTSPSSIHGRSANASPTPYFEKNGQSTGKVKSASLPPPVNRVDKPNILLKAGYISQAETGTLATTPDRKSFEERVSPFSTPPSSPEKSTTARLPDSRSQKALGYPRVPADLSLLPPPVDPLPRVTYSSAPTSDARQLGFNRQKAASNANHDNKSIMGRASMDSRDGSRPRVYIKSPSTSEPTEVRPHLPPRTGLDRSREVSQIDTKKPNTPLRTSTDKSPRSSNGVPPSITSSMDVNTQFGPPPRRHASVAGSKPVNNNNQAPQSHPPMPMRDTLGTQRNPKHIPDDSDEESGAQIDNGVSRTDYPDSSQANRRPPILKSGPATIPTKYDTRLFDVCGKYVCTTGYITKVWDLTSGEQLLSLAHGDTVKSLSVAFKPGKGLEDEGQRIWIGTSIGELHEIDVPTQSIVASRSYPQRREVVRILRHRKEIWTLDEDGRLLIWLPDESGTPNMQYSYIQCHDRVARGHTFSMIVGDLLWLATGKDVRIYRPNAGDDSFHVLKKPLGSNSTGEVTSGTHTSKNGGRVYLGHTDGKVSIYSAEDFNFLGSVHASVYKINSLVVVGDYLWVAFKTGMIYVYDVNTKPWTVKKDWKAHDSPVCGLVLDPSALWTISYLQVVSLGTDNQIRLWDGMLEDDWLELQMQNKDVEYCTFREIRAAIVTWNVGASSPRDIANSNFLRDAIHTEQPPEILVFGFQELVDLEDKKITAKSFLMGSKRRDNSEMEHVSRQYRVWRDHLVSSINGAMPFDEPYVLLHTASLVGLFTCIFIKQKERQRVRNVCAAEVKRGMGGLHGNKGALILRFVVDDSSLCFINCHLAAGQTQTSSRNNDVAAILESESLPAESSHTARTDLFVGGGDGTMILDHEICILNGDLNYRIDSMPRNVVIDAVRENNLPKLLERDQLLASKRKNPGFRLRTFNEAPITFAPTYKYDVGTDEYDSSEKKRSPAWCDRVLYRGAGRVKQIEYRRHEVRASDHRPVSASFKLRLKTVRPTERATTWETCQKEFMKEKRRLVREISIEYLVSVLGVDKDEARALITGKTSR